MQKIYTKLPTSFQPKRNLILMLICVVCFGDFNLSAQNECPNDVIRSVSGATSTFRFSSGIAPGGFGCLPALGAFENSITIDGLVYTESIATNENGECYVSYDNNSNQPFFPINVNFNGANSTDCTYLTSTGTPAGPAGFLPVEFTRFSGEAGKTEVYLTWQTATELNNSHFDVVRSSDGKNWEIIGSVDGSGTTQQTINYEFTDFDPLRGANYYALLQVDFDEKITNSKVIAVTIENTKPVFEIYPNPVSETLNIRLSEEEIDFPMEIYLVDAAGRQIAYVVVEDVQMSMEVSNLEKGFYFLQIRTNHQFFNQRFLKQ